MTLVPALRHDESRRCRRDGGVRGVPLGLASGGSGGADPAPHVVSPVLLTPPRLPADPVPCARTDAVWKARIAITFSPMTRSYVEGGLLPGPVPDRAASMPRLCLSGTVVSTHETWKASHAMFWPAALRALRLSRRPRRTIAASRGPGLPAPCGPRPDAQSPDRGLVEVAPVPPRPSRRKRSSCPRSLIRVQEVGTRARALAAARGVCGEPCVARVEVRGRLPLRLALLRASLSRHSLAQGESEPVAAADHDLSRRRLG